MILFNIHYGYYEDHLVDDFWEVVAYFFQTGNFVENFYCGTANLYTCFLGSGACKVNLIHTFAAKACFV